VGEAHHFTERRRKTTAPLPQRSFVPSRTVGGVGRLEHGVEHKPLMRCHPPTKAFLWVWDVRKGVRRKGNRTACAWPLPPHRACGLGRRREQQRMGSGDDMKAPPKSIFFLL